MRSDDLNHIPHDIRGYLDEIAERLWSHHAAVMVGAGFSKNAEKGHESAKSFPTWNELADQFYEKLGGNKLDDGRHHYFNPLKLADEVQAAFGRSVLDQMLQTHIPDKEYEPSELHTSLLKLPWVDVFTVNYDTLLERACDKITSRRFDVVMKSGELVYSTRPRIVKLHGSFPSTRPFIITEEDYRRYPTDHAPFVNTVQQSLLENTLVLLGFSGDDPNFLHWIGWVRDNLGRDTSPKIYLVGALSLTSAQRQLLNERNITAIDMAQCGNIDRDPHRKALTTFLDYLQTKKPVMNDDWPPIDSVFRVDAPIVEQVEGWRKLREAYPNWVIAPSDARNKLGRWPTRLEDSEGLKDMIPPLDLHYLYGFNWCLERRLHPIFDNWVPVYERIIDRYNPYPNDFNSDAEVKPERYRQDGFDWNAIALEWTDLNLSLLRYFREEGKSTKWQRIDARLELLKNSLSPEQLARWHYERCLNAIFGLELAELKKQLKDWPVNESLPFWEAKRAGLLAELGDVDKAEQILKKSLISIRSNLHLAPIFDDLALLSQESHVMLFLSAIDYFRNQIWRRQDNEKKNAEDSLQISEQNERLSEQRRYRCDPENELELFKAELEAEPKNRSGICRESTFDIDMVRSSFFIGSGLNRSALRGIAFLRYSEEVGLPSIFAILDVAKYQAQKSAEWIAPYLPVWAVVTMLRIGKTELANSLFSRAKLWEMKVEEVDDWVDRFIKMFGEIQPTEMGGPRDRYAKKIDDRVKWVVPEILSRLCTKCSDGRKDKVLSLLQELHRNPGWAINSGIRHLTNRLIESWSIQELCDRLPVWLEFPLIKDLRESHSCPEPFFPLYEKLVNVPSSKLVLPPIREGIVTKQIEGLSSSDKTERERSVSRLLVLYRLGLLSAEQSTDFGEVLWSQLDPDGFPENTNLFKSTLLSLPTPESIEITSKFKDYILDTSFDEIDPHEWVSHLKSIIAAPACGMDWTPQEAVQLLDKLIALWNSEKSDRPLVDGVLRFPYEFDLAPYFVAVVIVPRLPEDLDGKIVERLKQFLDELDEHGIDSLAARAACLALSRSEADDVVARIVGSVAKNHEKSVERFFEAFSVLVDGAFEGTDSQVRKLVSVVGQQIKWRREIALDHALDALKYLVEKKSHLLTNELVSDVLHGLELLKEETDEASDSQLTNFENTNIRLGHRKHAAALAFALFNFREREGKAEKEDVLLEWQRICTDPETFSDIRNVWDPALVI